MIDICQWRASIGLWNYCQAASSRPANGRHSHSFKAAVDSKSGSTTSGEKTSKLPAALFLIALLLLLFHSLSLLRHILMIPPTGNCYQVQYTTGVTVTDTNYLQSVVLPGGRSSNLIYNDLYLIVCLRMLLLLSGDVEVNPGPMIDDRPDISLLIQWLEPLVDWQSFGYCLPGITQHDVSIIEAESTSVNDQKRKLYSKWLSVSPEATWNDVITALTIRRENTLAQNIKEMIEGHPSVPNVSNRAAVGNTQGPTTGRELNMATVMMIFHSSAHHYMLIGNGLGVKVADLIGMQDNLNTKLHLVFKRWFDADKDVSWDTLIQLCDDYPDKLGIAKSELLKYIGLIQDTSVSDDPWLASHSASSFSISADSFVKRELTLSDHGTIMGLIEKDIASKYKKLAVEFCIPQGTINTIAYNNRNNSAWHGLNDVVADWLRGNTEVYDEGRKANVRWLYDAVRAVNKTLGTKIAKEFVIPEQSDQSTQKDKGGLGHLATSTGIEETDSEKPLDSTEGSKSDDQKETTVDFENLKKSGILEKWCTEGIMKLELTRVHMVGPAGSGKTCAQQLLLNEPSPTKSATSSDPHTDVRSATSSPPAKSTTEARSTAVTLASKHTTDSTPIACKAVKALRIASNGKETWKRITTEELLQQLAYSLKEAVDNDAAQQIQPLPSKEEQLNETHKHSNFGNEEQTDSEPDSKHLSSDPENAKESKQGKLEDKSDFENVFKNIINCISKGKALQLSEKWVYIVDSGGQPAYQELLPLFTRAATLNVITLDISKGIEEEFEFMYRINGQNFPCDRGIKYSNRIIFNSVVSSASVQKPIDIPFMTKSDEHDEPKHSMSFVLGTHYDVLIKEKSTEKMVEVMSNKLMSPENILPHLTKRIISKVHGNSVIYPVDTMQEDPVRRKETSKEILEIISECTEVTIEIKVPMCCFAFELYLEEKAKDKGFVTKEEAIKDSKKFLYMNEDDVDTALKFLHDSTVILYYPEVQPQLVFVTPQKILDVLSHLLALTYVDYPTAKKLAEGILKSEMDDLTEEGCFTKKLLNRFKNVFSPHFTPDYFVNLLQYLHIIKSQSQVEDDDYFLPSALPAYNNEYDTTHVTTKPLYYVWQEGKSKPKNFVLVPQGIFLLIYVHSLELLEEKKYEFDFSPQPKYRDAFSLWIYIKGKRYTLYIINRYQHIAVYFNGPNCPQVRKLIETAIDKSSDVINTEENYESAFPCPNGTKCYCIVNEEYERVANCSMCDSNGISISESDESYWCWFDSSSAAEKTENNGIEQVKTKSDDQNPPDVSSKFFPKIENFESKKKMKMTLSTQLTKEEQEFIKEVRYILVTATENEYRAVMGATDPPERHGKYIKVIIKEKSEKEFILGKYGLHNVAVIVTGQGPKETDVILTSVQKTVKAKYVIAIGICYGANESKTKLGDIIVAKSIVDIEHERIEGKDTIIIADTYPCKRKLVNLFKCHKFFEYEEDKFVKVHVGPLASRFTLFRSEEKKKEILKYVPQVLGGEMEANGINQVARREEEEGLKWIVIKAIVDWGTEEKTKTWQPFAAVSCARFVKECLNDPLREGKECTMAAVTKIFGSSAHHYMLIGTGLNVNVSDLMPIPGTASTNLNLVFQRWFQAKKNRTWDELIKLCDEYPDKLGKAKSNLLAYIGQTSYVSAGAEGSKRKLAETDTRQYNAKKLKVEEEEEEEDMPDIN